MISMPALSFISFDKLTDLPGRELTLSMLCWLPYLFYRATHCLLFYTFVDNTNAGPYHPITWTLQEYGIWLVLTPTLWYVMNDSTRKKYRMKLIAASCAVITLLIALTYRVGLDLLTTPQATFGASLVYFLPTHVSAVGFVLIGWWVLYGAPISANTRLDSRAVDSASHTTQSVVQPVVQHVPKAPTTSQTLTVQKGNNTLKLAIDAIDYIAAAGNYVEIFSADNSYLLRSTMKQLTEQLPENQFVRIHRSYIINIQRAKNLEAETLELHNTQTLPVGSKFYRDVKKLLKS